MPARPPLPSDDLYARLGIPTDASVEAIEVAWRALLRRHHPDVAGEPGLELAKRINVAHDWLTDPALRARYDRERGLRHASGPRGTGRGDGWHARHEGPDAPAGQSPVAPRRRPESATAVERFLARLGALTPTEIDRLALAEPPPIAFGATIRRFLPADRRAMLDAIEAAIATHIPPAADRPAIRDAIDGFATELVLGPFLDELLTEPFRSRTQERLTRGWEAAVGQPRYGPNGASVAALRRRIAGLDRPALEALAATGQERRLGDEPWPRDISPDDDAAFRVSSLLAQHDAASDVSDRLDRLAGAAGAGASAEDRAIRRGATRAAGRLAHLLVVRHAFDPATFGTLTARWRPWLLPPDPREPGVRRPAATSS